MGRIKKMDPCLCAMCFGCSCKTGLCQVFVLHITMHVLCLCIHALEVWCVSMCEACPVCFVLFSVSFCVDHCCCVNGLFGLLLRVAVSVVVLCLYVLWFVFHSMFVLFVLC